MKILVLNCGSSSVKYKLINTQSTQTLAEGAIEKIGLDGANLKFKLADGSKKVITSDIPNHNVAIEKILHNLIDAEYGCIASFDEINAVGHRLVHGGEKFNSSVLITSEVIDKVKECYPLAPLHNPVNIAGVEAIQQILPNVKQVGVFDTAFHQTMPAKAYMYALPYNYYTDYGVRKYGFHGTSHRYVSRRSCEFLGLDFESQKIITCHIGNGGSITAIANGKSVDTSMGLTPVDGIIMGTRSGSIDPGVFTFLMERNGLTADDVQRIINKESGMKGISGISSDMRDIDAAIAEGDERAILAEDMYIYSITKFIGSYAAVLGGVDVIAFTGGVGENQRDIRRKICESFKFMGLEFDAEQNAKTQGIEATISAPESKVKVVVIPTDEELVIAKDTEAIVSTLA